MNNTRKTFLLVAAAMSLGKTCLGQAMTFQQKCAQPGVIGCWDFDNDSKLFYYWNGVNQPGSPATACDSDPYLQSKGYNSIGLNRSGPGNTAATIQNGKCYYPQIDTTVSHSGAGSLKFTIPSNSDADSSGYFEEVFQRLSNGKFGYIAPGSPLGNVVYIQFYQLMNDPFVNTDYQCVGGTCYGWKQAIFFGNPPNGSSSSSIEVTMNDGGQRNVPQMYGQQGHDDYGIEDIVNCTYGNTNASPYGGTGYSSRPAYMAPYNPTCAHYAVNQWIEFTIRIEVNGPPSYTAGCSGGAKSRVQEWVNGRLVVDYSCASINFGSADGDGIGQVMLTPYHTNKDPSQATPVGYTWYDDLIVSTQPIPMTSGAPLTTPAPSKPTGLALR